MICHIDGVEVCTRSGLTDVSREGATGLICCKIFSGMRKIKVIVAKRIFGKNGVIEERSKIDRSTLKKSTYQLGANKASL